MRILVTGASGLLGVNVALVAAKSHEVYGVVHQHPVKTDAFKVIKADLLQDKLLDDVFKRSQPDWIIHCAALADLDACEEHPQLAERLNTRLPKVLAEKARDRGARFIHVSTDAVFDGKRGNYHEDSKTQPLSYYGITKLEGEHAVREVLPSAVIVRLNLFGWSLTGERSLAEFFFNNLAARRQILGFRDVYFTPLLANDLARVFLIMLKNDLNGLYHLGSFEKISKYDFGLELARRFGYDPKLIQPVEIKEVSQKATRGKDLSLNNQKINQRLPGVIPGLSTSLDHFYTLYQQGYPQKIQDLAG